MPPSLQRFSATGAFIPGASNNRIYGRCIGLCDLLESGRAALSCRPLGILPNGLRKACSACSVIVKLAFAV